MGLARLLGFCVAFLFASSVSAITIDLGPSGYREFGPPGTHTTGGITSSINQTVRLPPTSGNLTVTRKPLVPYGSIANGMRNFARINPSSVAASAAITALFLGLDWVFDEEVDSWMKEGLDPQPELGDIYWYSNDQPEMRYANPVELCIVRTPGPVQETYNLRTYEFIGFEVSSSNQARGECWYLETNTYNSGSVSTRETSIVIYRGGSMCQPPAAYYPSLGVCAVPGLIPLEPSDWSELESSLPSSPADTVAEAAGDVMRRQGAPLPGFTDTQMSGPSSVSGPSTTTTNTDPATGDTVVTTTSTTTNIEYGDTTITTTNTSTTNTYVNGENTGTETTTETSGELPVSGGSGSGGSGEWPGFCTWASVVCDWINWTQEEPPADENLPSVIDDDFYHQKNISFGSKSCPAPHEINLAPFLSTSVGVSFQPLCDFAGLIYYMVMAASYVIAAYISIGVARNG